MCATFISIVFLMKDSVDEQTREVVTAHVVTNIHPTIAMTDVMHLWLLTTISTNFHLVEILRRFKKKKKKIRSNRPVRFRKLTIIPRYRSLKLLLNKVVSACRVCLSSPPKPRLQNLMWWCYNETGCNDPAIICHCEEDVLGVLGWEHASEVADDFKCSRVFSNAVQMWIISLWNLKKCCE